MSVLQFLRGWLPPPTGPDVWLWYLRILAEVTSILHMYVKRESSPCITSQRAPPLPKVARKCLLRLSALMLREAKCIHDDLDSIKRGKRGNTWLSMIWATTTTVETSDCRLLKYRQASARKSPLKLFVTLEVGLGNLPWTWNVITVKKKKDGVGIGMIFELARWPCVPMTRKHMTLTALAGPAQSVISVGNNGILSLYRRATALFPISSPTSKRTARFHWGRVLSVDD